MKATACKRFLGAICVGIARRALQEAAEYGLTRQHRGSPVAHRFPTIQSLLGSAAAQTLAADALVLACADQLDRGVPIAGEAAAARLMASRAAREAATAALHVCGAYGLTREMVVERLYREAVFFDVAQGVAEIQQIIAGRELLSAAKVASPTPKLRRPLRRDLGLTCDSLGNPAGTGES